MRPDLLQLDKDVRASMAAPMPKTAVRAYQLSINEWVKAQAAAAREKRESLEVHSPGGGDADPLPENSQPPATNRGVTLPTTPEKRTAAHA